MSYALVPLLVALAPGLRAARPQAAVAATPPAILDYYRQHNLVTAFSTREERRVLAENLDTAGDARLERVARLMRRLEALVDPIDPGMTRASGAAQVLAHRSDLLRIKDLWINGERARVELEALALEPADNAFYVTRFEQLAGGDRLPDLDELLVHRPSARRQVRTEIHDWQRGDRGWKRAATVQHFIER
jgi:hypothetical protein